MTDRTPLITKKQAQHITKMFKSGKFPPAVFNYLGITAHQHRQKIDQRWKHIESSDYDPLYCSVIEKAHNWLEDYYFNQMDDMDARKWMFIMRAKFGWSTNAPYRETRHTNIVLEPDKPSKLLDTVISEVTEGNMSIEKGKAISELVMQSYNVKEIEPADDSTESNKEPLKEVAEIKEVKAE